jgi:DNA modification methylase
MQALVCDYSRPNDLIIDPYAGSGTTLLAAAIEGRRCIGAEMDPNTYDLAVKRLSAGYTPNMLADRDRTKPQKNGELFEEKP